jgi:hypothetical protein
MRRLSEVDETGDNIFGNAHLFYRDTLFRRLAKEFEKKKTQDEQNKKALTA